jgi:exodeoxyribonuclease VII small subunit
MKSNKMNFEEAIDELQLIVQKLEKGDLPLEDSLGFFQRGVELTKLCNKKLDDAQRKISILIEDEKGNPVEKKFDLGETSNEL